MKFKLAPVSLIEVITVPAFFNSSKQQVTKDVRAMITSTKVEEHKIFKEMLFFLEKRKEGYNRTKNESSSFPYFLELWFIIFKYKTKF